MTNDRMTNGRNGVPGAIRAGDSCWAPDATVQAGFPGEEAAVIHDASNPGYDLKERTARFGELAIRLCRSIPADPVNAPLITQLVKATTSVGANYCEADDGVSKKDFRHKIGICRKEARESKHFLRMLAAACPARLDDLGSLWQEAKELHLIFSRIFRSS